MRRALAVLLLCLPLTAQRFPTPGGLPGTPFLITKTWIIGGTGNWDYLAMDPGAGRLYIAHGPAVQVVDVETGNLAGTVTGFRQAHAIVLDGSGQVGYVSDGPAARVRVFDRFTLEALADIRTGPSPRALALDPQSGLLFAICSGPEGGSSTAPGGTYVSSKSVITVIDTRSREALANLVIRGSLGFAQAGDGQLYVAVADRNGIMRIDTSTVAALLRTMAGPAGSTEASGRGEHQPLLLDWSGGPRTSVPPGAPVRFIPLGSDCNGPRSLAVDSRDQRLFTACDNMVLVVTNADSGGHVASLPIGPGADATGYDPDRRLIFTANGGGDGSLTVIRQDVTDTYSVIQNLPTRKQARTLAVDPSSGDVYLVTVLEAAEAGPPPMNGIGTLRVQAIDSTFQVLVVGH
jgi:DNA-binding beta-propeller fold protein YncE